MGIDTILKISIKLLAFGAFMGVVYWFLNYILSYIPTNIGLSGCAGYYAQILGLVPAITIFLKIIVLGFSGKQALAYLRNLV
jgi:hypothetical protein